MSRWQPDARERLEKAALELFTEQGFGETTVPQITARAGLTTRTFFRHFADKREVLFANDVDVPALASRMIAEAPPSLTPLQIVEGGLEVVAAAQFAEGVEYFERRKAVIESDPGLRERELRKMSALADALRAGFIARGVDELTATLSAQVTTMVFGTAIGRWLQTRGSQPLPDLLHDTLNQLRALLGGGLAAAPGGSVDEAAVQHIP
ncbi:TetR/AcrR family transcriptional regulator [Subtercola endophyticus]|uniref:TetR/AcrR family transcriptional regulator n=1 Tax=Subtercola endophyticus TaxID=2895559 RepID=UPI001E3EE8BC|nr:TetR/AcrR family transcriptional regulator [Subtercola endophyticus]UFS59686.1 TetR/AcrR family transcriptional regulator [Subtercola endophyticus]